MKKTREELENVLQDALLTMGVVVDRPGVRSFGDDSVDICNCYFKCGNSWYVAYVRQCFGLSQYYYDCDVSRHPKRSKCIYTRTMTTKLIDYLSKTTRLKWEGIT